MRPTSPFTLITKISSVAVLVGLLYTAGFTIDGRYAKAADVERALTDLHQGLQALRMGQLQTARALLAAELFNYQTRGLKLTDLERQHQQDIQSQIRSIDREIDSINAARARAPHAGEGADAATPPRGKP